MTDFSVTSLANLTQDDVNKLSEEEYKDYLGQCSNNGYLFRFNGKQPGPEEANYRFYGSNKASIHKDAYTNKWDLVPVIVAPEFEVRPVMLTAEVFKKQMLELGAPADLIDKMISGDVEFPKSLSDV